MKKIAIITGATGGIGQEFVRQILRYDLDEVWAVGRSETKLKEICHTYGERIITVVADLSEISGIEKIERIFNYKFPFEYISRFEELLSKKERITEFFKEYNKFICAYIINKVNEY